MRSSTEKYRSSEHDYFFPAQICSEILSYLPVKSLLRFRSVCTTWKSIIEHPDFTFLHLKHYPKNILKSEYILLEQKIDPCSSGWSIRNRNTMEDIISKIESPNSKYTGFPYGLTIPGSVNGLLLLSRGSISRRLYIVYDLMLWNPSLKKYLHLPIGDTQIPHNKLSVPIFESYLGFGGGDHKVMIIIQMFSRSHHLSLFCVKIFSLNTRSWHKLEVAETRGGFHCLLNPDSSQVTLGGSIYWIGGSRSNKDNNRDPLELVNFDVSSESFSYTNLPKDAVSAARDIFPKVIKTIVVRGSYLGIIALPLFWRESFDTQYHSIIWTLTELSPLSSSIGTNNSAGWTKWCAINLDTRQTFDRINFFCPRLLFMEARKVPEERRVRLYDLNTPESKIIALSGRSFLLYVDTYIESLLLL